MFTGALVYLRPVAPSDTSIVTRGSVRDATRKTHSKSASCWIWSETGRFPFNGTTALTTYSNGTRSGGMTSRPLAGVPIIRAPQLFLLYARSETKLTPQLRGFLLLS